MSLSLNEVSALVTRSTRGAGYAWGLAEEAGRAARYLCAQGMDGCAAIANLLQKTDGIRAADLSPRIQENRWSAADQTVSLCPIITGCTYSDRMIASSLSKSTPVIIEHIALPVLLLPFASVVAIRVKRNIKVGNHAIVTGEGGVCLTGTIQDSEEELTLSPVDEPEIEALQPKQQRAFTGNETLAVLKEFAHRTYAPATAESRLKGAGAGILDTD